MYLHITCQKILTLIIRVKTTTLTQGEKVVAAKFLFGKRWFYYILNVVVENYVPCFPKTSYAWTVD